MAGGELHHDLPPQSAPKSIGIGRYTDTTHMVIDHVLGRWWCFRSSLAILSICRYLYIHVALCVLFLSPPVFAKQRSKSSRQCTCLRARGWMEKDISHWRSSCQFYAYTVYIYICVWYMYAHTYIYIYIYNIVLYVYDRDNEHTKRTNRQVNQVKCRYLSRKISLWWLSYEEFKYVDDSNKTYTFEEFPKMGYPKSPWVSILKWPTVWGPPVISWFISPSNYSYLRTISYHKP